MTIHYFHKDFPKIKNPYTFMDPESILQQISKGGWKVSGKHGDKEMNE